MDDGYKSLIADLDGTIVRIASDGSEVTDDMRQAVQDAREHKFDIACATGRPWELAKPVIEALGLSAPCIVEGGARIIEPGSEATLWEKSLEAPALQAALAIFQRESDAGRVYTAQLAPAELSTVTEVPQGSRFIYLLDLNSDLAVRVAAAVDREGFAAAHVTPSWSGREKLDVHVTHPEATKQHAAEAWQQLRGISMEQTIGMGDSRNDIPLFRATGTHVAVEDADPEIKRLADYVVPHCKEGALIHVLTHFHILA